MEIPSKEQKELLDAVSSFVSSFELVFDIDWELTQSIIADPKHFIEGTFIHPNVEDESNNWWNRGSLLGSYRHLKALLVYRFSEIYLLR